MSKDCEDSELRLFSGNANIELAREIAEYIGQDLADAEVNIFADGETKVKIKENVRGRDVFIIQPTCPPVNQNLMELLTMIDALKRSSARRITAVMPYYGYARQDRKAEPRVPITAKLVANLLVAAGADRILTLDLHAGQIQGFFDIPVDNIYAAPVIIDYLKQKNMPDLVIISPDTGGVDRARKIAKHLKVNIAVIDKRRYEDTVEMMYVVGDVRGKNALIVDDIIDTGNTIIKAAEVLLEYGVEGVYACCTHAVLSKDAQQNIENSHIKELIVTDTIPIKQKTNKITVLSVVRLLGEAIIRTHCETSVSSLFV